LPGWRILFVFFFVSGTLGLMYEVVWLRMLGLVFGHTVYAITTVLAAFMAGLALGSFLLGRRAPRIQNLIRAYGWLEIGIGLYCALIPLLLKVASSLYLALHHALGLSYNAFSMVQFLLVFALLLVPTTLMGGTLPVLSQALARSDLGLGRMVSGLYAANTFGAVGGVALAGYFLLPELGNRATTTAAAIGNVVVGVLAVVYSRRALAQPRETLEDRPVFQAAPSIPIPTASGIGPWLTVAALGVSGAVSMAYEVAWTRALALVLGSSTYAFSAMLVAFLAGIAGGSALYGWLWGSKPSSPAVFAALQAMIGISTLAILLIFARMPELFLLTLRWSDSPTFVQLIQVVISASCLLLPTLFIGATFPCAVAVAARGIPHVGKDVGQVYAVNTLGAIVGTVLAGFVLLPAIGAHGSIKLGIALNLLLAAALFAAPPRPAVTWPWGSVAAVLMGAGVFFLPPWDQRMMSSGPAVYAKSYLQETKNATLTDILRKRGEVLFYRDGISGTVAVHRSGQNVFLRVNGKTDASTGHDMATQLMLGHLPLLVHRAPKAVLVIGLGSGITAGAVARHPIERLDVVEIEPAVVEAARFFAEEHGDVLKDPRVRTVIADGRNFLLTTSNRYDVIISEPSNPWIGGLASLFSVEFFQLARQRLEPGGIMLQWVQGYNLLPDDLRMVVKTFRNVFPATSIWNTTPGDFLLLGQMEPTPLDLKLVEGRFSRVRPDRLALGFQDWPGVLGYFMLGEQDTRRFSEAARLNTDDRLPLEFSAPRALYLDTVMGNQRLVRSFKVAEFPDLTSASRDALDRPDVRYWIGANYLSRGMLEDALSQFQQALQLDPEHAESLLGATRVHLRLRRPAEALGLARRVIAREPLNADAFYLAGLASRALNANTEAAAFFERAANLEPQNDQFRRALGPAVGGSASPPDQSAWPAAGTEVPYDRRSPTGEPVSKVVP
jgi:spermidine synthase